MSNIESCTQLVIVPKDEDRSIIGPFTLAHGGSLEAIRQTAHELGYKDDGYQLLRIISVEEALSGVV